jgi:hypothetical protein
MQQQNWIFCVWSVRWLYNENNTGDGFEVINTGVEAESNTSTVTLRIVGGDEKGSLIYETVKFGRESQVTRTREWLRW